MFMTLDKDMGAEFDALAEGKVAKGHNLSHLAQNAKIAKEFRNGPWVYYKALAKIFDVKGGSSTVKGTYALDFVNRQIRKEASSKRNVEAQDQHEQGQEPPAQGGNDDGSNTAGGHSNHRQSKRAKSSHQGRTIDAIGELGESNKGVAAAFSKSLEQESTRTELEKQILQALATTNIVKQAESTYRKQCTAAQVISELPEFREISPERQFAVQDWILVKDHAEQFIKVIPAIRGAWLTRQLTTVGQGKVPE
ncbi:hypothetical protein QFC21_004426 [Naganishia friedmannii]|uniref:Uncharacterized protein n=1 Tax=Naganishia friedmannii TaxID=89922 RepID=A0ACC2VGM9_9TREE|nr:hypothetical protein QFC21_004426 [Naganishia friedmannii]